MKTKKALTVISVITLAVFIASCSAKLTTRNLDQVPKADGELTVAKKCPTMKKGIGWGTFTVFFIPVAKIKVEGQPDEELMRVVNETVQHVGYKTEVIDGNPPVSDNPAISVEVKKFKFYNYTWFFPLVFNWGTIKMDVKVTSPDGNVLWQKEYIGKGSGWYDFDPTVNKALIKVLNQLAADMASEQFQSAVFGSQGGAGLESNFPGVACAAY